MGKFKQLAIEEAERDFEEAHDEWQIRQHEEEEDAKAMIADQLERRTQPTQCRPDEFFKCEPNGKPFLGILDGPSQPYAMPSMGTLKKVLIMQHEADAEAAGRPVDQAYIDRINNYGNDDAGSHD